MAGFRVYVHWRGNPEVAGNYLPSWTFLGGVPVLCPCHGGSMTARRPCSRTGLSAVKALVKLWGLAAIDMRTVAARQMVAFRNAHVAALGGEDGLSPSDGSSWR